MKYWSITNRLFKNTQFPNIPPTLINDKLIFDFQKNSNLLNIKFASLCTPVKYAGRLWKFKYTTYKN